MSSVKINNTKETCLLAAVHSHFAIIGIAVCGHHLVIESITF
jgi:hypothetical protein